MLDESLEKINEIIIRSLEISDIPLYDKLELLLNLRLFLEDYENNIKVLKRSKNEIDKGIL